jgi:hypothetical protein
MISQTHPQATAATPDRGRRLAPLPGLADGCLALAAGLSVLAVHNVTYILKIPFWLDESWVAASVRAPLRLVPSLTASTPIGWTLLLRLVPFGGPERLRLVPLAFAGLAAAIGYLLGRELRLTRYATGLLTAAAVLLSPAMLIRDDLKQYTAEACACLLIWYLVARAENAPRWRRLVAIAVTSCVGVFFAASLLIVGVAAMAALAFEYLVRRQHRDLLRLLAVAGCMCVVLAAEYELLMRPNLNGSLHDYWSRYFVPVSSPAAAASFVLRQLSVRAHFVGFNWVAADAVGVLAGIVALVWLRRYALAVLLPFILIAVIGASAAGKYPFGDIRTSTFWLVLGPVLMAIAIAAIAHRLAGVGRITRLTRRAPVAVLLIAAALAGWIYATHSLIRSQLIPDEGVRPQVNYVLSHFRQGDVIVVSYSALYGFDYYYPVPPGAYVPVPDTAVTWVPAYPRIPWIVLTQDKTPADISAALVKARQLIASEPARHHGRVWIVQSHVPHLEALAYQRALAHDRVITIKVADDLYPLLLVPGKPS